MGIELISIFQNVCRYSTLSKRAKIKWWLILTAYTIPAYVYAVTKARFSQVLNRLNLSQQIDNALHIPSTLD